MNGEEIVAALKNFGLDSYQAKIYFKLVLHGPMKAREVAIKSGVPMPRVYDAIETLVGKNMVEVLLDSPKMYRAIQPEIAFKNLIFEQQKNLQQLEVLGKNVAKVLRPTKEEVIGGVWASESKTWVAFFSKAAEMADKAQKYLFGITREYTRSPKLRQALKNAVKRKVKVHVIGLAKPTEENYLRIKWLMDNGCEVRTFESHMHPRILNVDGKEVLIRLDHDPSKREGFKVSSLWSADISLVKVFDAYLKSVWQKAKPVNLKNLENV